MSPAELALLIHLAAFATGAALYALLGVMAVHARGARVDRIPLATAVLGLVWNGGGLALIAARDFGAGTASPFTPALALAALGFLPALVVHSGRRSLPARSRTRHLVPAAFAVGAAAMALHLRDVWLGRSSPGLEAVLTPVAGYAVVTVALAISLRGQPWWRRALPIAALAAFAVMMLHLARHADAEWWPAALAGHHLTLVLAAVVLYQDYRFAAADLWLERAAAVVALVAAVSALYAAVVVPHLLPAGRGAPRLVQAGGMLLLWALTALAFPLVWRGARLLVGRVLLRRPRYAGLGAALAHRVVTLDAPERILDAACDAVAGAVGVRDARWRVVAPQEPRPVPLALHAHDGGQEAEALVPTTSEPSYLIEIGDLAGGRRLCSAELALLAELALVAARRIDAARGTRERFERALHEQENAQLSAEAELRTMRLRMDPRFLLGALTAVIPLMRESPAKALDALYRLTGLLRAVLRRGDGEFTTLAEEMDLVERYLAIEQARLGERLAVTLDVPPQATGVRIPPLLLVSLVESAVAHCVGEGGQAWRGCAITVAARLEAGRGGASRVLRIAVGDSGAGAPAEELRRGRAAAIGRGALERRLARHYGAGATVSVRSAPDEGTMVELRLPVDGVRPVVVGERARAIEAASDGL